MEIPLSQQVVEQSYLRVRGAPEVNRLVVSTRSRSKSTAKATASLRLPSLFALTHVRALPLARARTQPKLLGEPASYAGNEAALLCPRRTAPVCRRLCVAPAVHQVPGPPERCCPIGLAAVGEIRRQVPAATGVALWNRIVRRRVKPPIPFFFHCRFSDPPDSAGARNRQ